MSKLVKILAAEEGDLAPLVELEEACFNYDRLSRRRFQHWLKADNRIFLVVREADKLLGYGLVLLHKGTRLARLYSLAVAPSAQGMGVGTRLLLELEEQAAQRERIFMRLEVAQHNMNSIHLYEKLGYIIFGEYPNYYDDHSNALRMQKRIRRLDLHQHFHGTPWYQQTTEFTCGPASLMMAMASLDPNIDMNQELELDLWREATTIFMTSGHGGCHPLGLALAARRRGFDTTVMINTDKPLFIEGVRSERKKQVMVAAHNQFQARVINSGVHYMLADVTQDHIQHWLEQDYAVVILISTYRMDGRKVPHWVCVTAIDDFCLYVHDPEEKLQDLFDCQHIPIARDDFAKMSTFGSGRLRTAIAIKKLSA